MSLLQVKWAGMDGSVWDIRTTGPVARGVMLVRPSGLVSNPARSTTPRSTGRGVRVGGVTFPEMTGGLVLRIFRDKVLGMTVGEVYDAFLDSLSTTEPGGLTVVDGKGREWSDPKVLLASEVSPPATSPHAVGLRDVEIEVPLIAESGIFSRDTMYGQIAGAQVVEVPNRGNIDAFPTVLWDGQARTITTPYGQVLNLPAAPGPRRLSTDPGTGYVITDDAGVVDSDAWATMRGIAVPGTIPPRGTATWTLPTGVRLLMTEYKTNVWR